jgi:hypothetical protein
MISNPSYPSLPWHEYENPNANFLAIPLCILNSFVFLFTKPFYSFSNFYPIDHENIKIHPSL